MELYKPNCTCIYNDMHIHIHAHFLKPINKRIQYLYHWQGNVEAHTCTLKVVPGFTSFSGCLESTTQIKVCIQFTALQSLCYFFSQWTLPTHCFFRYAPNVILIPYVNANDQNIFIPQPSLLCFQVPQVIWLPHYVHSLTFQVPRHPLLECSIPWQGFLALEGPKTKAYPSLKTIIPVITSSWK